MYTLESNLLNHMLLFMISLSLQLYLTDLRVIVDRKLQFDIMRHYLLGVKHNSTSITRPLIIQIFQNVL